MTSDIVTGTTGLLREFTSGRSAHLIAYHFKIIIIMTTTIFNETDGLVLMDSFNETTIHS